MKSFIAPLLISVLLTGCYTAGDNNKVQPDKPAGKPGFVLKETIVTGKDTGMNNLGGFKKTAIRDVLCQHWEWQEKDDESSYELLYDARGNELHPGLNLFKDGTVLENPRGNIQSGTWQVTTRNRTPLLLLSFSGQEDKQYLIRNIKSHRIELIVEAGDDRQQLFLVSDALTHQDMMSDPFHPANNHWRFKPGSLESDSAVKARVKQCIKFYALYFRDNIKRHKKVISFEGLPEIFRWYSGGIGLPDKEEISSSWVNCFYTKEQALQGYDILRKLIVDYEFDWPKKAPNWVYQTHSVLEQMYHKM